MLSKSKFIRGLNCSKSLWLYVHKYNERETDESTKTTLTSGTNIGEFARNYFPNGEMAVIEDYPCIQSAKRTAELINQGIETIYEATFIFKDTIVAIDILHKINGKWNIYEVKSTNSVKDSHYLDASIQYYVANGCGIDIENVYIMHFDREYIKHGKIDIHKLFKVESVYDSIILMQDNIPSQILSMQELLKKDECVVEMGKQCESPYTCDFYHYCCRLIPEIECEKPNLNTKPEIIKNEIRSFVEKIKYPICHLDFETIMPAIPMFDESRPYQQIPFQYSIHYQENSLAEIIHYEYLAEAKIEIDPRIGLIEKMIIDTRNANTILVYNISFERTRIKEMIRDFPIYAEQLEIIIDKMIDLIIPFRKKYYYTESMLGSASIKKVLPALCPDLAYDNLEISNGMDASNSFMNLYFTNDSALIKETRDNLLKYCHLDTYAMVRIFDIMKKV